jgi:hypothetical protein
MDGLLEAHSSLLDSLRQAVEAMPGDLPLRVHLAACSRREPCRASA